MGSNKNLSDLVINLLGEWDDAQVAVLSPAIEHTGLSRSYALKVFQNLSTAFSVLYWQNQSLYIVIVIVKKLSIFERYIDN